MFAVNANTMNNSTTQQLEISLSVSTQRPPRRPQPARPARASWWFARMREIVDNAVTCTATQTPVRNH